jgi:hypothetical protein
MNRGRPSKFNDKIQDKIKLLALKGFTDKEISQVLEITEQTLNNWKISHPDFFEVLNDWKATADAEIERSLYERAHGYSCPETKPQWVQDENGGHWEYAEMIKHYPPDPTSMIFWLKNRQRDKWRDKHEVNVTGLDARIDTLVAALSARKTGANKE